MGKILITGSSGVIGKALCNSWHDKDIVFFDRKNGQEMTNEKQLSEFLTDQVDTVIHLAALSRVREAEESSEDLERDNIKSIHSLIRRINQLHKKPKVIFASSREVYGNSSVPCTEDSPTKPCNAYGESKLRGEILLKDAAHRDSFPLTVLRLSNIYGCSDDHSSRFFPNLFDAVFQRTPMKLFGGQQSLDFFHIEDLIKVFGIALEQSIENSNQIETINVSSGKSWKLIDIVQIVESFCGPFPVEIHPPNSSEVEQFTADNSLLRNNLDVKPLFSLEERIQQMFSIPPQISYSIQERANV